MKIKSIAFVLFTLFLSILILSNGQQAYANESDYDPPTDNPDGTVTITKYRGPDGDVRIPDELDSKTVTGIGEGAFEGTNITSIKIPKSVTEIGGSAFWGVTTLSAVEFEAGSELHTIGSNAFVGTGLTTITLPKSVKEIGLQAFWSAGSLRTVEFESGSELKTIGSNAFRDSGLTTITLPKSVTEIIGATFYNARSLRTVEFESGSELQTIGSNAFQGTGLTTITLPKSVTKIGSSAFLGVNSLSTVEFEAGSKLQTIGNQAFQGTVLTTITIPKSVTEIGFSAFQDANSLSAVEFESGSELHTIRENAFANTDLTSIRIPSSVVRMGKDIFSPKTDAFTIMSLLDNAAHKYATDYEHQHIPLSQLKYNGNGHTAGDVPEDKEGYLSTDPTITVLSHGNLEKDGFQFVGWNTASDGSGKKVQVGEQPLYQDVGGTLYAQWSANEYTVTFDSRGGSAVPDVVADYGTQIIAPTNPTKSGYTFGYWFTGAAVPWDFSAGTVQGDLTLIAMWIINKYTITFDSQGGSAVPSVVANYNTKIIAPTNPTKSGHTFVGWFTDTDLTMPWDFSADTVQADLPLYAKWIVNEYTITFDSQGGSAVPDIVADYDTQIIAPTDPTKSGHTFVGWFADTDLTMPWDFSTDTVRSDLTLYAKWIVNEYPITFDSQGGSAVPDVMADYDTQIIAPTPPTRSGRIFVGWFTDPTYATPWDFAVDKIQGDLTLYAKWKVKSRPTPPPLNIQATMTVDEELTEEQLDGSTITVNVSDTSFMMSLTPEHFELQNAPTGLTIRAVHRISSTEAVLTFASDGTPLDQDYDLGLTIQGAALTTGFNVIVNDTIQIQKSKTPYKIITKEGTFEPTKVWTVKLSNEVDASTVQDALYIVDTEGNRIPATFTSEGRTIFIHPPTGNYADGTYTLYITSKLKNKNGTDLKEPIKMIFTIK